MRISKRKTRIAVVSPFLDKRHGTERIAVEWITQLADQFEIHIYSQRVQDLDLSRVRWHRIPELRGPHILNFVWWLAANQIWRSWDSNFRDLKHDLTYSPGINCFDADVISVHIIFAEFLERVRSELNFSKNRLGTWPRLLHRRIYYALLVALERMIYSRLKTNLVLTSRRSVADMGRFYARYDALPIIEAGLDHQLFNPARRLTQRSAARQGLQIKNREFVLLLIGNDWRKKGLLTLLKAVAQIRELPVHLVVVTEEVRDVLQLIRTLGGFDDRVSVLPIRSDVEFYYAAADAYVGPSLEDTFALPVAEAMACGLPVIVSASAGASEIVTHGSDGLILENPRDSARLAELILQLYGDEALCRRLGQGAATTAQKYTWEENGRQLVAAFAGVLSTKERLL